MQLSQKILILILFVFVSLLTRGLFLPIDILDIDESANAVGSWILLDGKLLYTDFIDNKPPGLYAYYAMAQLVFGRGLFAVHFFTALLTIPLTAFGASAFFNHSRLGILAGLLFLIFSAAFLAHDMHATHAEILMILPGTWALVSVRDRKRALKMSNVWIASFLIGVGVLLKYQIAAWLAPVFIAAGILKSEHYESGNRNRYLSWIRLVVVTGFGFSIPLIGVFLWFYFQNRAADLLFWTIQNNITYSANPISAKEAIGRAASYLLPFLIATSPLWWCSWKSRNLFESNYRRQLLAFLIVFSIPPTLIGFRFYPHYFIQLYIPLCLASTPYIHQLFTFPLSQKGKILVGYIFLLLMGFTIANFILYYLPNDVYRERDPVFQKMAFVLKQDSCSPNASLFVWGYSPILYYRTGFAPASRFVAISQSGLTPYVSGNLRADAGKVNKKHWELLMKDLEKNKATYIIDTSPSGIYRWDRYPIEDYPRLQDFLESNYDRLTSLDGMIVYRNKECVIE